MQIRLKRTAGTYLAGILTLSDKPGKFIISLDCEGKWGMADKITPFHDRYITKDSLTFAYQTLCERFNWYDISATFAFVMGFVLNDEERKGFAEYFCDDLVEGRNWLTCFRAAEKSGNLDGWFCPEALEIVKAKGRHEIAAHGFSHVPLSDRLTTRDVVDRELKACHQVAKYLGLELETFVYPRNDIGHVDALAAAGFQGYRAAPSKVIGVPNKLSSLLMEANIFGRAESEIENHPSGISIIPGGYMVNWQHGPRKIIPAWTSSLRWGSILSDAANNGRTAHLWLHPHNILTAPETLDRLDDIFREAVYWRDKGKIEILTQSQFVNS